MAYYKLPISLREIESDVYDEVAETLEKIMYALPQEDNAIVNAWQHSLWHDVFSNMPKISEAFIEKHIDKPWDWKSLMNRYAPSSTILSVEFIDKHIDILRMFLHNISSLRVFKMSEMWFNEKYMNTIVNVLANADITCDDVHALWNNENYIKRIDGYHTLWTIAFIFNNNISIKTILSIDKDAIIKGNLGTLLQVKQMSVEDFLEMKNHNYFARNGISETEALEEVCKNKCGVGIELFRRVQSLNWSIAHLCQLVKTNSWLNDDALKITIRDLPLINKLIPYRIFFYHRLLEETDGTFLYDIIDKCKRWIYGDYKCGNDSGCEGLIRNIKHSIVKYTPINELESFMKNTSIFSAVSFNSPLLKYLKGECYCYDFDIYFDCDISQNKTLTHDFVKKHKCNVVLLEDNAPFIKTVLDAYKKDPSILKDYRFSVSSFDSIMDNGLLNHEEMKELIDFYCPCYPYYKSSFCVLYEDTPKFYIKFEKTTIDYFGLICKKMELYPYTSDSDKIIDYTLKKMLSNFQFSEDQFMKSVKIYFEDATHPYRKYWKWQYLALNKHITPKLAKQYKHYFKLFMNIAILNDEEEHTNFRNFTINWNIIEHVDCEWDYDTLSFDFTTDLDPKYVLAHPNKGWVWEKLVENSFNGYIEREIQERIRRHLMAFRIQCHWRKCYYDPHYTVCKNRLLREYEEYVNDYNTVVKNK